MVRSHFLKVVHNVERGQTCKLSLSVCVTLVRLVEAYRFDRQCVTFKQTAYAALTGFAAPLCLTVEGVDAMWIVVVRLDIRRDVALVIAQHHLARCLTDDVLGR